MKALSQPLFASPAWVRPGAARAGSVLRRAHRAAVHPDLDGLCSAGRPAAGLRAVRVAGADSAVCDAQHDAGVHLRRRRRAGRHDRRGAHVARRHARRRGGHAHRAGADAVRRAVAGRVRTRARGQGRRLHLRARHGRVHQRRLLRDHPHAGAKIARLRDRHGRAVRAAGARF